jgi:endonuclease III related protein
MSHSKTRHPSDTKKSIVIDVYNLFYKIYGPQRWWPARTRLEVAIGAILTQNTSWSNVEKAISNLKRQKLITADRLRKASLDSISSLIVPSGYYNIKAERLKNFIDFLYDRYKGDIALMKRKGCDDLRKELLSVKGIGPETADSILLYGLDKPVFVVDAYTRRIAECLGIAKSNHDYSAIQSVFMDSLPENASVFNEYHALIVRHAKDICKKRPLCSRCILHKLKRSKNGC